MKIEEIAVLGNSTDCMIELFSYLIEKCACTDWVDLTKFNEQERTIYLCQQFEIEINNGGFDQFFFNNSGRTTKELLEALEMIDAKKQKEILIKTCGIFPNSQVPTDDETRQSLLEKLTEEEGVEEILANADDELYDSYEDGKGITDLCYQYFISNIKSFG